MNIQNRFGSLSLLCVALCMVAGSADGQAITDFLCDCRLNADSGRGDPLNLSHGRTPALDIPEQDEASPEIILDWELSQSFPAAEVDVELIPYPRFYTIFAAGWHSVSAEPSGLVDIARHVKRNEGEAACAFARSIFRTDKKQEVRLNFMYSDEVVVYLNGKKLFYGMSDSRFGEPATSIASDMKNAVYLTLERGLNEIFLLVKSSQGEWGFAARTDRELERPLKDHNRLTRVWETGEVFLTPESVLYDSERKVLYVSSFDNRYRADATRPEEFTGYISKVKLNGEVEELKWVDHLFAPCGMGIYGDKLYTVERGYLAEIDIESGKVVHRYPVPGSEFLNDLAIDREGNIYMTDTAPSSRPDSRIYKFSHGKVEVWEDSYEVDWSNGLYFYDDRLLVGNSGDGSLKSIHLATKRIDTIACLGAGVVDGIRVDKSGSYLVSHWEGQLYSVSPSGEVVELMDTIGEYNCADFEFIREQNLLVIPTFVANRVMAYRLK